MLHSDRKREKEEDRLAKERIKAQIEADKQARLEKQQTHKNIDQESAPATATASSSATPIVKGDYKESRIQARLPSGPITKTFPVQSSCLTCLTF